MRDSSHSKIRVLGQVSMLVKDIPRAVDFYQNSLGMTHLFTVGSMAFFDCSGVRLMLTLPEKESVHRPSSILYFKVESTRRTYAELMSKGVTFDSEPHLLAKMQNHDLWMAFFRDTEDNLLALMSEEDRDDSP